MFVDKIFIVVLLLATLGFYNTVKGDYSRQEVRKSNYEISSFPIQPSSWDVVFDCKIKKLAFDYAKKLSPGTGNPDDRLFIFKALQLGALCNETFLHDETFDYPWKRSKQDEFETINVFVDNRQTNKFSKGSFMEPLLSIQDGINMCLSKLNVLSDGNKNCIVYIRQGTYEIQKPLQIFSNIELRNFKDEEVVLSGFKTVKPAWKLYQTKMDEYENLNPIFEKLKPKESTEKVKFLGTVSNKEACKKLCTSSCNAFVFFDQNVKNFSNQCYGRVDGMWNTVLTPGAQSGKKVEIYSADLSQENLNIVDQVFHAGGRLTRARFPNADPVTQGLHTIPTGWVPKADKWLPPRKFEDALEIHIQSPTRNETLFPAFQIGIGGPLYQFDPPRSYWGTKHPFGGGGSTYTVPSGLEYAPDLEINTRSWKNLSTGIVHAFQGLHWENWIYKLDDRNEKNRTLSWTYGGFQGARGQTSGGEWYVENIFEELDVANEWFFDESSKILYLMPNLTVGSNHLPKELASLVNIVGSQDVPVKNAVVSGMTLMGTTTTFLEPYMVPSGGDWTVHRNGMVYLEGTENVVIEGCVLHSPGGNGIFIHDYNRGTIISHNTMFRLGDNGIVLVGEARLMDGSIGNQPRGVQILYNVITENGIWGKQTYPFVQSVSCETHLEGNAFFSGPRAGMNFNDGFGGGNNVESNLLFNFVRETDDHGPINTWDRVPYLTRVADGKTVSLSVKENTITTNFIINNYRSVWPIDHDDGTCYWRDTRNYLVYGGFKNYLGHDKIAEQNIYVYPDHHPFQEAFNKEYCVDTAGQTKGTSGYGDVWSNNICVIGKTNIYTLGQCSVDTLETFIPHFANNKIYTPDGTMIVQCGSNKWNLTEAQARGIDIGTKVGKLPPDDDVIQWGKDLLGL